MAQLPGKPVSSTVLKYFLFLFLVSILLVGRLFWPFLSIFVLSFLLVNIFRPIYMFLARQHMSKGFASMLTCGLIVILVFVPLTYFVIDLSHEAVDFFNTIKKINFADEIRKIKANSAIYAWVKPYLDQYGISLETEMLGKNLSEFSRFIGLFLYNQASSWAANIINFVINFALMILTIFFLLIDYDRLIKFLLELSPLPDEQEEQLVFKFQEIAKAVIIGNGICGVLQGALGGLLFAFFHLGAPMLWGGVMAVLAFLPILGIGLVLLPTALILFVKGSIGKAIFVAGFYGVLSLGVEYLLKPKLVGKQVQMHTLLVFFAIIGGLSVFGILGIIYGPLIMTMFLTMSEIYLNSYYWHVKAGFVSLEREREKYECIPHDEEETHS